jgi:hypothetical protein
MIFGLWRKSRLSWTWAQVPADFAVEELPVRLELESMKIVEVLASIEQLKANGQWRSEASQAIDSCLPKLI